MKEDKEAEELRQRMDATAVRISQTPSGERFLNRIYEISRPKPLHSEPEEDQGE